MNYGTDALERKVIFFTLPGKLLKYSPIPLPGKRFELFIRKWKARPDGDSGDRRQRNLFALLHADAGVSNTLRLYNLNVNPL